MSIKSLTMVALAGSMTVSCDLMKDVDYKITPSPLEMHGDSVRIKAEATFPEKGLKKKASAEKEEKSEEDTKEEKTEKPNLDIKSDTHMLPGIDNINEYIARKKATPSA